MRKVDNWKTKEDVSGDLEIDKTPRTQKMYFPSADHWLYVTFSTYRSFRITLKVLNHHILCVKLHFFTWKVGNKYLCERWLIINCLNLQFKSVSMLSCLFQHIYPLNLQTCLIDSHVRYQWTIKQKKKFGTGLKISEKVQKKPTILTFRNPGEVLLKTTKGIEEVCLLGSKVMGKRGWFKTLEQFYLFKPFLSVSRSTKKIIQSQGH